MTPQRRIRHKSREHGTSAEARRRRRRGATLSKNEKDARFATVGRTLSYRVDGLPSAASSARSPCRPRSSSSGGPLYSNGPGLLRRGSRRGSSTRRTAAAVRDAVGRRTTTPPATGRDGAVAIVLVLSRTRSSRSGFFGVVRDGGGGRRRIVTTVLHRSRRPPVRRADRGRLLPADRSTRMAPGCLEGDPVEGARPAAAVCDAVGRRTATPPVMGRDGAVAIASRMANPAEEEEVHGHCQGGGGGRAASMRRRRTPPTTWRRTSRPRQRRRSSGTIASVEWPRVQWPWAGLPRER